MAEETKYTAVNGLAVISTANTNLDGTGTLATLITGALNGTLIKKVWIKAQGTTTQGMIRLFVKNGGNTRLLKEIYVPAVTPSATDTSFETQLNLNFTLQSGAILKVGTEKGESFGITAEGMNWEYYTTGVRTDTTKYTSITGLTSMNTANSNLNGTGTIALVYLYNAAYGITIESICIKSTVSTTHGMIRLYVQDDNVGSPTIVLLTEVSVPAITKSSKVNAFEHTIVFDDDFELQNNYSLYASTEKGETFKLFTVGLARSYAA